MELNDYFSIPKSRKWTLTFLILVTVLYATSVCAQQYTVKGTLTDLNDGTPLIGANVFIKSTNKGTITDVHGNFSLETSPEDILILSYIGYKNKEVQLTGESNIQVSLEPDLYSLNEIVVVGFGEQKKVNLSGAVDVVGAETLENRPINSVGQGLQGAIPNLNIDFFSGEPGATPRFNIRGYTSINGGEPLIIVDGVPTDPDQLNLISPDDIASVSVLKDASSAAIYGARAAYGVIMVTTKSGRKGGMIINYTNNFAWSKPTVVPKKITDPYIYLRLQETSTDNTPWDNTNYSDETYQWAKERSEDPGVVSVRLNPNDESLYEYMGNQDWTRHFLDDYTFSQKNNLSLGGSTDEVEYYLSGSYDNQNGALSITDDYFQRYTARSKVNYSPAKWFSIGNNTLLALTGRSAPNNLNLFDLYNLHPTDMDKNPDGTWANTDVGRTAALLTDGGRRDEDINMVQSTFSSELSFLERMVRLNADFTFRRENNNFRSNNSKYKIGYGPEDVREEGNNSAYRSNGLETYSVLNIYGTIEQAFGAHFLTAILGYNQEYNKNEWFFSQRDRVISSSLPTVQLATGDVQVGETIDDWSIRGAFYRLNYIYNDRYIVEFNGRYDGSSKFPKDKRFGIFPSFSAAWRVDSENFWQPLSNTINHFKLRGSYGALGNQSEVPNYGYLSTMSTGRGGYLIDGNLPVIINGSPAAISPNYTWEKVTSTNFGVDLGFFQHKLVTSFDIYKRETTGMLIPGKELPGVFGASAPRENAGDLETKGWEFSISYDDEFNLGGKPLTFNSRFVLSDSRAYITRFDNPNKNLTQYYEGMEIGEIWGLQSDGLFQTQEEIDALDQTSIIPWGALAIVPGWPKYKDLNDDDAIEKGFTVDDPKDLSIIGNVMPRLRFGFNLGAAWNGFDVNAFFQGVGKMDYYPLHYLYWGFYQQPYAGGYEHLLDFYRAEGDSDVDRAKHSQSYIDAGLADANTNAEYPVLQSWLADRNLGERIDQAEGLAIPQTGYLLNGAYLRLKNLTVGYTLPFALTEKINVAKVRIYISGENITEWSGVKDYFDPEAITDNIEKSDPTASTSNGWGYAYPFQRRYSIGLNVQF